MVYRIFTRSDHIHQNEHNQIDKSQFTSRYTSTMGKEKSHSHRYYHRNHAQTIQETEHKGY